MTTVLILDYNSLNSVLFFFNAIYAPYSSVRSVNNEDSWLKTGSNDTNQHRNNRANSSSVDVFRKQHYHKHDAAKSSEYGDEGI